MKKHFVLLVTLLAFAFLAMGYTVRQAKDKHLFTSNYANILTAINRSAGEKWTLIVDKDATLSSNPTGTVTGLTLEIDKGVTLTLNGISLIEFNIDVEDGGQVLLDQNCTVNGTVQSRGNTSGVVALDANTGDETLTMNGGITASRHQIIGSSLSVSGTPQANVIWAEWFGNNAQAITDASTWASSADLPMDMRGDWTVTSTPIITSSTTPNTSQAIIRQSGTDPTLKVGSSTAGSAPVAITRQQIWCPKVISTKTGTSGWSGEGTGIEISNAYSSEIHIPYINGFEIGVLLTAVGTSASGKGCGYNSIYLGQLYQNKVQFKVEPGATTHNWVNENLIVGGRYSFESAEGIGVNETRQLYIGSSQAGGNMPNQNIFLKPSIEGDVAEWDVEIKEGTLNKILYPRVEGTPRIYFSEHDATNYSLRNVVEMGYSSSLLGGDPPVVTQSANSRGNRVIDPINGDAYQAFSMSEGMFKWDPRSINNPVYRIYANSDIYDNSTAIDGEWQVEMTPGYTKFKQKADNYPQIQIDHGNGEIYFGNGAVDPKNNSYITRYGTAVRIFAPSDAAEAPLTLQQDDTDQPLIRVQATDTSDSNSTVSSWTAGNSIQKFIRISIAGTDYWMPVYDAPTGP